MLCPSRHIGQHFGEQSDRIKLKFSSHILWLDGPCWIRIVFEIAIDWVLFFVQKQVLEAEDREANLRKELAIVHAEMQKLQISEQLLWSGNPLLVDNAILPSSFQPSKLHLQCQKGEGKSYIGLVILCERWAKFFSKRNENLLPASTRKYSAHHFFPKKNIVWKRDLFACSGERERARQLEDRALVLQEQLEKMQTTLIRPHSRSTPRLFGPSTLPSDSDDLHNLASLPSSAAGNNGDSLFTEHSTDARHLTTEECETDDDDRIEKLQGRLKQLLRVRFGGFEFLEEREK